MNDKDISLINTVSGKIPRAKSVRERTSDTVMDELLASQGTKRRGEDSVSVQAKRSSQLEADHPASLPPLKAASRTILEAGSDADPQPNDGDNRWMDVVATCIGIAAIGAAVVALSGPLALAVAAAGARLAFAGITSEVSEDGLPSVVQKVGGAFIAGAILPYSVTAAVVATIFSEIFVSVDAKGSVEFGFPPQLRLTPLLIALAALVVLTQSGTRRRDAVGAAYRRLLGVRRRLRGRTGDRFEK